MIPEAKLPSYELPEIGDIPVLPNIGCAGASSTTFIGNQFGNVPDVAALLHLKQLKYEFEQWIQTLIEGYDPALIRKPLWVVRVATYTAYVAQVANEIETLINRVIDEANAAINFANQKIAEIEGAIATIEQLPEEVRTQIQTHMLDRYNTYIQELNSQITRHQQAIACIGV